MTYHMDQDDPTNVIHVYPSPTMPSMCNTVLIVGSHGNAIFHLRYKTRAATFIRSHNLQIAHNLVSSSLSLHFSINTQRLHLVPVIVLQQKETQDCLSSVARQHYHQAHHIDAAFLCIDPSDSLLFQPFSTHFARLPRCTLHHQR